VPKTKWEKRKMQQLATETNSLCQHSEITVEQLANYVSVTPLAVLGGAQRGKTTLAKHIVEALNDLPNVKTRIWDSSTKWLFKTPAETSFKIPQPKLLVYQDSELVSVEYAQPLTDCELKQILACKCLVFDSSEIDDIEYERQFQQRVIGLDKTDSVDQIE
jgi:hypothetical protein